MDRSTLQLLARYNAETNRQMDALLAPLRLDQWTRSFAGYFPTLAELCRHLVTADFVWLRRFGGLRPLACLKDPVMSLDLGFGKPGFADLAGYLDLRPRLDRVISNLAHELTEADLAAELAYTDSRGQPFRRVLGGLVLHMFNHQTHHRGMVSLYLEELGIENDFSNLAHLL